MKRPSYSKPNYVMPSLPLHTSERAVLIEGKVFSHLLNPKWWRVEKVPFAGTPGDKSSGGEMGL